MNIDLEIEKLLKEIYSRQTKQELIQELIERMKKEKEIEYKVMELLEVDKQINKYKDVPGLQILKEEILLPIKFSEKIAYGVRSQLMGIKIQGENDEMPLNIAYTPYIRKKVGDEYSYILITDDNENDNDLIIYNSDIALEVSKLIAELYDI